MKNQVPMGTNRTGVDLSPVQKKELAEVTALTVPSSEGDETNLTEGRASYLEEGTPIGSMPPPTTVKGVAKSAAQAVTGTSPTAFLDKLGERLAFERTGTRLYETLIDKFESSAKMAGGPSLEQLQKIHAEELAHFEMLRRAVLSLGADPTVMTPSADVAAVMSMGVLQVVADPRISFVQSLEAILVAELVDNDCWDVLVELADAAGKKDLAAQFRKAVVEERDHLMKVRSWVKSAHLAPGKSS
jgi:hypothetical protein